jgi:hypothetical protein
LIARGISALSHHGEFLKPAMQCCNRCDVSSDLIADYRLRSLRENVIVYDIGEFDTETSCSFRSLLKWRHT